MPIYSPKRHYPLSNDDTELGRWLVEEFPDIPGLFLYLHTSTLNFMVAQWSGVEGGHFEEILTIGNSLGKFTPARVMDLRNRLRQPTPPEEIAAALRDGEHNDLHDQIDKKEATKDRKRPRKIQILTPHNFNLNLQHR